MMMRYRFAFKDGSIVVYARNYKEAKILAQAEAIPKGWDYEEYDCFIGGEGIR